MSSKARARRRAHLQWLDLPPSNWGAHQAALVDAMNAELARLSVVVGLPAAMFEVDGGSWRAQQIHHEIRLEMFNGRHW